MARPKSERSSSGEFTGGSLFSGNCGQMPPYYMYLALKIQQMVEKLSLHVGPESIFSLGIRWP